MTMIISGDGTIAGLVAGGLPDATITSAELAANAVNAQALTLFNASGSAPVYAWRAWVNFNGTGTVVIRASGNVSSITDNGVGVYTVNFATAMLDTNYAAVASKAHSITENNCNINMGVPAIGSIPIRLIEGGTNADSSHVFFVACR